MASDGWSPVALKYDPLKAGSIDGTDVDPHDRGIVRAINATYRPNRGVVGSPECTVFVAQLHPDTTEDSVSDHLAQYGRLKRVKLIRDIITGFSKCYAFVEYENSRDAARAQRDGHQTVIDGVEILVDYEVERTLQGWVPRRLGGGFGGKKEAGQLRFGGKDRPFRKPIFLEKVIKREPGGQYGEAGSRRPDGDRYRDRDSSGLYNRGRSRSPDCVRARRRPRSPTDRDRPTSSRPSRGDRSPSRSSHRKDSRRRSRSRSRERHGRQRPARF